MLADRAFVSLGFWHRAQYLSDIQWMRRRSGFAAGGRVFATDSFRPTRIWPSTRLKITMVSPGTFSDLKDRERKNRKNLMIDAAERVFASKPFDEVSMRDIASEAGISHATIYRYFPDQQTLFVDALVRGVEQLRSLLEEAVAGNRDAPVDTAADAFIGFLSEKITISR